MTYKERKQYGRGADFADIQEAEDTRVTRHPESVFWDELEDITNGLLDARPKNLMTWVLN